MNILVISDLAHTGFGRVGRELSLGLIGKGYDVRIIGINVKQFEQRVSETINPHLVSGRLREKASEGFQRLIDEMAEDPLFDRMLPASTGIRGQSHGMGHPLTVPAIHGEVWEGWHADATILVGDAQSVILRLLDVGSAIGKKLVGCHGCNHRAAPAPVYNYVPIEGVGIPRAWELLWRYTEPVAMTVFGQTQLEALLGRSVPMIPHGASTAFHPVSPTDPGRYRGKTIQTKDAAKAAFGLAGKTVVLRIDRHIHRKNYGAFFRVMRPILAKRPDVVCVIHTKAFDEYGSLHDLISREPGATTHDPDDLGGWTHPQYVLTGMHDTFQGLSDEDLTVLYNAADLLVSPTMAEGFGLTHLEALACEVPVVTTDYSAMPEVVGPGGVLIPPKAFITNPYAHEWALVDEDAMTAAVERLIAKPAERRALGRLGRKHAARYTWSAAVDAFDELLNQPAAVAA